MFIKLSTTTTPKGRRGLETSSLASVAFLAPALVVLVLFNVYPIIYTVTRSFFDAYGSYVGFSNYQRIATEPRMLIAMRNNAIWVAIVPATITSLGLIWAVLSEKIRWSTAFKMSLFMPLVVSGLAAGVTFRFIYAGDPNIGLANAVTKSVVEIFQPPGLYPGARLAVENFAIAQGGGFVSKENVYPGSQGNFGLIAVRPQLIPQNAEEVRVPTGGSSDITGAVWFDFIRGGGGTRGVPDPGKQGLPGVRVVAVQGGKEIAAAYTSLDGSYRLEGLPPGGYELWLHASSFRQPFGGLYWLGPNLIIPSLIFAYIWINTGFAVMMIGAGLASLNRDYLEAASVEGASAWQMFRFITVPLLMPLLMVVFVRSIISVLKVFDLVMVIAPESVQAEATVLALEMWNAAFGGMNDHGLGSALATILFLLILPVMLSNIRRFRLEQ